MKIIVLGAAGFIGTNLALELVNDSKIELTLVDEKIEYFNSKIKEKEDIKLVESKLYMDTNFDELVAGQDVVYHLFSSVVPTTSNQHIEQEINSNVISTIRLLDACVRNSIKNIIFISSGGTVYGKKVQCPIKEDSATDPINSYGIQKLMIEKLLQLYNHLYGIDYRIVRLSNPYGPYQRPNGVLGAVTTFTYKALNNDLITIYGNGDVVRDYIYIEDAIAAILKVANGECEYKIFNIGSGVGISLNQLIGVIKKTLNTNADVRYTESRKSDVPVNYLDVSRFESCYGTISSTSLEEGIIKTANYLRKCRY